MRERTTVDAETGQEAMVGHRTSRSSTGRAWIVLLAAALLEAVWAIALDASRGFSDPLPTAVFAVGVVASMLGLGYAMREIPISIAYAVWTGAGAALTVLGSFALGIDEPSLAKLPWIAGIVGCVIGLRFARDPKSTEESRPTPNGPPPARG